MSGAAPITGAELRRLAHAVKGGGDIAQAEFEAIVMQVADQLDARPHGYFYRYPCGAVLYNHGEEVNGTRPIEAIPYWLGGTSDAVDHHPSRIFRAGYRQALTVYRPDLVDRFDRVWPQNIPDDPKREADDAAVDEFARLLKAKLARAREKGRDGWQDPAWTADDINRQLHEHAAKGDPLDVAAYCMFLAIRGEKVTASPTNEELSGLLDRQLDRMHRETEQLRRELLAAYGAIPPDQVTVPLTYESLGLAADKLAVAAIRAGLVLTIEQRPLKPLAMGHHETVVEVREARVMAAGQEGGAA